MNLGKSKTLALMLASLPLISTCSTAPYRPPMPAEVVTADCPEATPIIDRSFRTQPPLCVIARKGFQFVCTPDPAKQGYCKETFADAGLASVDRIVDDATCLKQTAEWLEIERQADKGFPNG